MIIILITKNQVAQKQKKRQNDSTKTNPREPREPTEPTELEKIEITNKKHMNNSSNYTIFRSLILYSFKWKTLLEYPICL
jgi:hypothetical protein